MQKFSTDASREVGLETNSKKNKHMLLAHCHNAGHKNRKEII
jgi:hypothetical protein